jgi:hypothetical protein
MTDTLLDQITRTIVERFHPRRVILFGRIFLAVID